MSTGYRTAPHGPPDDVVEYRPMGSLLPWLLTFMVVGMGFGIFIGIMGTATSTDVTCGWTEAGGSCILITNRPILGEASRIVPLSSVYAVAVRSRTSKSKTYHRVVLVTPDGEIPLSAHESTDGAAREQVRAQLQAFLADRQHASITIHYDVANRAALWGAFVELGPLYVVWLLFQHVRVVIDWNLRRFRVERTRWPFRPWIKTLPLDQVGRARLLAKAGSKGGMSYWVELELVSGDKLQLSRKSSNSTKHHDPTIQQINALLARRDAPGP
ncbi:MAG: hypothetical protein ABI175_09405 [Polyangiales bacterium]